MAELVPPDFEVPLRLATPDFVLEPLGPEHNERDYEAWTTSMKHIVEVAVCGRKHGSFVSTGACGCAATRPSASF